MIMADRELPSSNRVLLVEGQDDKHVVLHLCGRSESIPAFCISDKDGIDQLLDSISPEIKVSGRKSVGSVCQKIDIYLNTKNKWRFEVTKIFHIR